MKLNFLVLTTLTAFTTLTMTGCLRTRAQLKEDGDSANPPSAQNEGEGVQLQEVKNNGYVIDEIKSEITKLTGRLEDIERAQSSARDSDAKSDEVKRLETRILELETAQSQMLEAIQKMRASGTVESADLFEQGKTAFESGDHSASIEALSEYLKNPKAKHLQEATFLRAESYFALKQFKKAIVDYSKFPEKFTGSKRMPQALYKIGLSFEALGMREDAKNFYQELTEKFPKSNEGKQAKSRLR